MATIPTSTRTTTTRHARLAFFKIVFLVICALGSDVEAHILVYRIKNSQLVEEYNDMPAQFGPALPANGIRVLPFHASSVDNKRDDYACDEINPPDQSNQPLKSKYVAIIQRGGNCTFEKKVRRAQEAKFDAVIVYNNDGDDLEQMSATNPEGIKIPSVFVGHTTGIHLFSYYPEEIVLVINDELPFNINTQLILPFSILIGLCFLIMIFYMIYKCIREERRLRRYRLPKRMLKQLPILKYTKNTDLSYDTCVICLEEFVEGDKLRVLPCRHPYHSHCIDPWLTENRRVCPICKRKVFTKGELRSNRNRQSSLDSVTDTDDDTTPLLHPSTNVTSNQAEGTGNSTSTTTYHGTFTRNGNANSNGAETMSDDENVLLTHPSHIPHSRRRINPFDRSPNLPPHLAEQLNESRRSIWSYPIFRLFARRQPISVAAPPFLNEAIEDIERLANATSTATIAVDTMMPRARSPTASSHTSNNILNPNLSGSFKDDEEMPHQSIYEPIDVLTISNPTTSNSSQGINNVAVAAPDPTSVFIQTPSQGGIGVVALPNSNLENHSSSNDATNRNRQFHI